MNRSQRRIDLYNKLIEKEDNPIIKKYRRDTRSRSQRRIDMYNEIVKRNEKEKKVEINLY